MKLVSPGHFSSSFTFYSNTETFSRYKSESQDPDPLSSFSLMDSSAGLGFSYSPKAVPQPSSLSSLPCLLYLLYNFSYFPHDPKNNSTSLSPFLNWDPNFHSPVGLRHLVVTCRPDSTLLFKPENLHLVLFLHLLAVVVVQSLSRVQLFATPWPAACQASLSFSWSLLKLISIELVMLPNHFIPVDPDPPALNLSQHQGLF